MVVNVSRLKQIIRRLVSTVVFFNSDSLSSLMILIIIVLVKTKPCESFMSPNKNTRERDAIYDA